MVLLSLWGLYVNRHETKFPVTRDLVSIDMNQSCLYGMTALNDKSLSLEDIKAANSAPVPTPVNALSDGSDTWKALSPKVVSKHWPTSED
jgi:hypothetical protein